MIVAAPYACCHWILLHLMRTVIECTWLGAWLPTFDKVLCHVLCLAHVTVLSIVRCNVSNSCLEVGLDHCGTHALLASPINDGVATCVLA